jgi:hypothetical protein
MDDEVCPICEHEFARHRRLLEDFVFVCVVYGCDCSFEINQR